MLRLAPAPWTGHLSHTYVRIGAVCASESTPLQAALGRWESPVVSEATLISRLTLARRAIGDRGREQRLIQTVHGRGYRFITPVEERVAIEQAPHGTRQLMHVAGEAGLEKTTLVETFLHELGDYEALQIGHGQCIEHYGVGEACLPVLEASGSCTRSWAVRNSLPSWPGRRPPGWCSAPVRACLAHRAWNTGTLL
jgi:hypothetical protein